MEEYTTSKKIINHKTKQVETRVKRQIVMEDGKIIADSGPQISSKTKEDSKTEESESTGKKVNKEQNKLPGVNYIAIPGSEQVTEEKFETRNVTREAKQESMRYHDESTRELTGFNVHQKAIASPNELISVKDTNDEIDGDFYKPKGKLTHFSSKSHKVNDREEVKEISKRDQDGQLVTETTRTNHHEEVNNDEVPESEAGPYTLPEHSKTSFRKVEFRDNDEENELLDRLHGVNKIPLTSSGNYLTNNDDIIETSRTKAGGNIIKIEMSSTRKPNYHKLQYNNSNNQPIEMSSSNKDEHLERRYSSKDYHQRHHQQTEQHHLERRLRSPSPDYNYDASIRSSKREDASVQASFSSSEGSDNEQIDRNNNRRTNKKPSRTFFFGDDKDWSYHHTRGKEKVDHRTDHKRQIDRKYSPNVYSGDEGFISSTFENKVYSSQNGKVLDDSSMNDAFHRSYYNSKEKEEAKTDFNDFLQRSKSSLQKSQLNRDRLMPRSYSPTSSITSRSRVIPITYSPSYSSSISFPKETTERRYRETIDTGRTSKSSGFASTLGGGTSGRGTWSKSEGRRMSPLRLQDRSNWPEFSPLLSPSEIRSVSPERPERRSRRY